MLIRRQDLSVLSLYCLGFSQIRRLAIRLKHQRVASFLTFHDLQSEALEYFEANLSFLKRSMNVVSLDDFFAGRLTTDTINVVITFDDGYKSWITHAVPVLKRLSLPATFFISSGLVGLPTSEEAAFMQSKLLLPLELERKACGLSLQDVKRLVEEGFTVGGHTVNHYNLTKLQDEEQLRYEISEDRVRLQRMTGAKIEYFSYPFGAYQHPRISLIDVLRDSGYRGAVTTAPGFNSGDTSPYLLNRELTPALMPEWVFRARAYGNYDAVRFVRERIKGILRR
jgi:peptidoglycan/xylan/chitin deacetylase (PgdA/CDA1 family)